MTFFSFEVTNLRILCTMLKKIGWLLPVGPFHLWPIVARFRLCIEKWGIVLFTHCKCAALQKPEMTLYRSVTCSGHDKEHEIGQFWIKNKQLWLGTLPTTFNPGNTIAICSKKIKHAGHSYSCVLLEVNTFTCYNNFDIKLPCFR